MTNKTTLWLITILGVLLLAFHSTVKKKPEAKQTAELTDFMKRPANWQGKFAPDFEAKFLDGQEFRLSEQIGKKAIVLNFFATWCDPCNEEMPELVRYADRHGGAEPFLMIGIDADEKKDTVQKFTDRHKVSYPVIIDQDNKLQKLYGVRSYPTTVFIGTDGIIHIYQIGPVMNADVAFDSFYRQAQALLNSGKAIDPTAYKKLVAAQEANREPEKDEKAEKDKGPQLSERAKGIAAKMNCPCGCDHKVSDCGCKTGKDIKNALAKADLTGKTDSDVIKQLNKEFCVKDDNCR